MDHVIAVSHQVARSITGDATVIYNGINPKRKINSTTHDNKFFTILAIGRLDPIKGFAGLIDAASKLVFPFCLQITGIGSELLHLCALRDKLKLKNIQFLGFRNDIPELISAADLVVINSITEGFSLVLMESPFYGNVLISTPTGGSPEILSSEFLFERQNLLTSSLP